MKYIRIFLAVSFLPFVVSFLWEFVVLSVNLFGETYKTLMFFWAGIISYFVFQIIFSKPIRTYVFGHELTHAVFGLLDGAKVKKFKVTAKGGSVTLNKTSLLIVLSPYFVPIYTIILIIAYWLISRIWDITPYTSYFLFLIGFTVSFHIGLTYFALSQGQNDLKHFGVFFSLVFILLINCVILACILKLLFVSQIDLSFYFKQGFFRVVLFWQILFIKVIELWKSFQ